MLELHPNILRKNGKEEFVVLPYEEFVAMQELLEDAEDLKLLREARQENAHEPGISLDEAKKRLAI
ncbi:MAG: type II toxin-antitoxin system Phd/YefM family antitoxin [Phycisphaerales bacterium]|nr:type II toxin-antitoxin system Phd/YefM family antitoxin [Phycisphaerales bacterium]